MHRLTPQGWFLKILLPRLWREALTLIPTPQPRAVRKPSLAPATSFCRGDLTTRGNQAIVDTVVCCLSNSPPLHFAYMTGPPPYTPIFPETPTYASSTSLSVIVNTLGNPVIFLWYCAQLVQHSPCTQHHTPEPGSKMQTALWELPIPYQASVPSQGWS